MANDEAVRARLRGDELGDGCEDFGCSAYPEDVMTGFVGEADIEQSQFKVQ